ncbi:hypothetical protein BJF77_13105 [Kocuria sp. CNJ-770]|uniref:hypothetical protein n=1 Tax=Kocuria sp. CNJ-770 TaxID=1904964 RepID=UPI000961F461|nr:hypothetical protein [Kocuria sp. CNJ-770]OLT08236.1 hypothetical protein BJF77_13105 [Kocuria sp. CNJ-770]
MDDTLAREQAARLHRTLEDARIGGRRLWVRYLALGGTAGELEVEGYRHGCLDLPVRQRDLLAWAANTLLDRRFHPRVPSSGDLAGAARAGAVGAGAGRDRGERASSAGAD